MSHFCDVLGKHGPDPGPPRQGDLLARALAERNAARQRLARIYAENAELKFQLSLAHQQLGFMLAREARAMQRRALETMGPGAPAAT